MAAEVAALTAAALQQVIDGVIVIVRGRVEIDALIPLSYSGASNLRMQSTAARCARGGG